ncbi:hypothetical protein FB451DRAFT_1180921 [Mycena latifolia]|nr:hypothetical protein FB451DRAFT_1180921 [Mycena latifolia]
MPGEGWQTATRETAGTEVREDVNKTTLCLYSFRVFVDCVWLAQKVGDTVPLGWHPVLSAGTSTRKRPRIEDIGKTAAPKKRRVCVAAVKENIDLYSGIRTRSGKIVN